MGDPADHAEVLSALPAREQALIAGLIGGGMRNAVAAQLGLSTAHATRILHRLRRRAAL